MNCSMATPRKLTSLRGNKLSITDEGLKVIAEMATNGQDLRTIAARLGCSHTTLLAIQKRDEATAEAMARGKAALSDELVHLLLTMARKGNVVAAIFLAKARLGWRENEVQDVRPNIVINLPDALPTERYLQAVTNQQLPHLAAPQPKGIALPAPPSEPAPTNDPFED